MNKNITTLGVKLKEFRLKKFPGLPLRKVADDIGVGYSYLHRVEEGAHVPSDEILKKMTSGYCLDLEEELEIFTLANSPEFAELMLKVIQKKSPISIGTEDVFYRRSKDDK